LLNACLAYPILGGTIKENNRCIISGSCGQNVVVTVSLTNFNQDYLLTAKVRNQAAGLYISIFVRKSRVRNLLQEDEAPCKLTGTSGKHCS